MVCRDFDSKVLGWMLYKINGGHLGSFNLSKWANNEAVIFSFLLVPGKW